jgi:hypothetical protein
VAARAGEKADVGQGFDFIFGEEGEEIGEGAVGVTDGPERVNCHGSAACASEWGRRNNHEDQPIGHEKHENRKKDSGNDLRIRMEAECSSSCLLCFL